MKFIVSELGPIDRHPPGTDVTEIYSPETLQRLVEEGYVVEQSNKKGKAHGDQGNVRTTARG